MIFAETASSTLHKLASYNLLHESEVVANPKCTEMSTQIDLDAIFRNYNRAVGRCSRVGRLSVEEFVSPLN